MTDIITIEPEAMPTKPSSLFNMEPKETIAYAKKIAEPLADVIEKQKLYSIIQGKKYVKCEGWTTLGALLGIVPRETSVTRLNDGSYEAHVDLINFTSGRIVGGSSALCSIEEKRWGSADDYARRSMAITRATGKAFRLGFSWIMTLAGYQPTPAEEMPVQDMKEKPRNIIAELQPIEPSPRLVESINNYNSKVPKEFYPIIAARMTGKMPYALPNIIKEVMGELGGNIG